MAFRDVHVQSAETTHNGISCPAVERPCCGLKTLQGLKPSDPDQKAGIDIVRGAIQVPARQIAENAGEDGSLIVGNHGSRQLRRDVAW